MPSPVADIFRQAAELNQNDPRRDGNVVHLGPEAELVVAGDIHGYRKGLAKIIKFAALGKSPRRHLVLQEIIHGPADPATGRDRSAELLLRAARLKVARPDQTLFVLGNHDIAQITGNEIVKDGQGFCKAFTEGMEFSFGDDAAEVAEAIDDFSMSLPLAVRCANDVLICHSLPSPGRTDAAGTEILHRPYACDDFRRGRPVYEWLWGRRQTAEQLEALADKLDAKFFVTGHQHIEAGCEPLDCRGIIIVSDHPRGCVLRFDSAEPLTAQNVAEHVRFIAALP